jgi:hypothetical protein
MARERLVALTPDLPESDGFPLHTCNWCVGTGRDETKAVVALEHEGKVHRFYGACGNHAEVLGQSTDWTPVA